MFLKEVSYAHPDCIYLIKKNFVWIAKENPIFLNWWDIHFDIFFIYITLKMNTLKCIYNIFSIFIYAAVWYKIFYDFEKKSVMLTKAAFIFSKILLQI